MCILVVVCLFLNIEIYFVDEYKCDNFIDGCFVLVYISN